MKFQRLIAIAVFAGLMNWATGAYSAPIYIGLQETGVNGGAITNESGAGGEQGTASISSLNYGNTTNGDFLVSVSAGA
jgi:hypothetical protein